MRGLTIHVSGCRAAFGTRILEFMADKIPFVSAVWDTIHTFIRPVGGAFLSLGAAAALSPVWQTVAFLAGGSVALGTHSTKMGFRVLAHASPEPLYRVPARRFSQLPEPDNSRHQL
jgi:hypothetical protein